MFANMTNALNFQGQALIVRADRQRVIASNIANADTPGYKGRDFNFQEAMASALDTSGPRLHTSQSSGVPPNGATHPRHIPVPSTDLKDKGIKLDYTPASQPAMDGNSVDLDRERANFVDNSVRYEATLRFINGSSRTILSAIQGQ